MQNPDRNKGNTMQKTDTTIVTPTPHLRLTAQPFYKLKAEEWLNACNDLCPAELKVLFRLRTLNPFGDRIDHFQIKDIASDLKLTKKTVGNALEVLSQKKYIDPEIYKEWDRLPCRNTEQQIRDRLQEELGGQAEVTTAVGRIDLLTEDQIIEIKGFAEWESALGQILSYGAFFPNHRKRIHLFGAEKQIAKLPNIEAACNSFNVLVTGEVAR